MFFTHSIMSFFALSPTYFPIQTLFLVFPLFCLCSQQKRIIILVTINVPSALPLISDRKWENGRADATHWKQNWTEFSVRLCMYHPPTPLPSSTAFLLHSKEHLLFVCVSWNAVLLLLLLLLLRNLLALQIQFAISCVFAVRRQSRTESGLVGLLFGSYYYTGDALIQWVPIRIQRRCVYE